MEAEKFVKMTRGGGDKGSIAFKARRHKALS